MLGVLPLGTANDFARTLDIPDKIAGAADVLADGKIVDVDLGWGNDQPFVNVASLGLSVGSAGGPQAGAEEGARTGGLPGVDRGRVRPAPAVRRCGSSSPSSDFEPAGARRSPAGLRRQRSLLRWRPARSRRTPASTTTSSTCTPIKAGRLSDHLSLARLLRDGTIIDHEDVQHLVTRALRLTTDAEQAVNLDGEIVTSTPVDFRIQRNAVEVVVPQHVTHVRHDSVRPAGQRDGRSVNSSTNES